MITLVKTVGVVVMSATIGTAWAECPNNLNAEQMYDCIVSENSSDDSSVDVLQAQAPSNEQNVTTKDQRTDQAKGESAHPAGM